MSLYNKHRPNSFDEYYGNESMVSTIQSMIENKTLPHTMLFYSDHAGVGKTTLARIVAKEMGTDDFDISEMDIGSLSGVQNSRDIGSIAKYKPAKSSCRFWILDEVANASSSAQDALLKLLEEPPKHAYFILCTTDPHKLKNTIKSRCSQFKIPPASPRDLQKILKEIASKEEVKVPRGIVHKISKNVEGQIRDAINILEQVISSSPENMEEVAKSEIQSRTQGIELCRELVKDNPSWSTLAKILKGIDANPEQVRNMVMSYFSKVLLNGKEDAFVVLDCFDEPFFYNGFSGLVKATFEAYQEKIS